MTTDQQLLELLKLCQQIGSLCDSNGHFQQLAFKRLAEFADAWQADMDICDLTLREICQVLDDATTEFNTSPDLSTETVDN